MTNIVMCIRCEDIISMDTSGRYFKGIGMLCESCINIIYCEYIEGYYND